MVKTHIASAAALFTFGLAALGGTVVAVAVPANAATGTATSSSETSGDKFVPEATLPGTAGPADVEAREIPDELEDATRGPNATNVPAPGSAATQEHVPFPHTPHSVHEGQGKKGGNNTRHPHGRPAVGGAPAPATSNG